MAVSSVQFHHMSPFQAQLGRVLASRQKHYSCQLAERDCQVQLGALLTSQKPAIALALVLDVMGEQILLGLDRFLLEQLLPGKLTVKTAQNLPKDLFMAAIASTMTPVLEQLGHGLDAAIVLNDMGNPTDITPEIMIQCRFDQGVGTGFVASSQAVSKLVEQLPVAEASVVKEGIPWWVGLLAGRSRLSLSLFKTLEIGDVIFLQETAQANELMVRVSGSLLFIATVENNKITIAQRATPMDEQELPEVPDEFDEEENMEEPPAEPKAFPGEMGVSDLSVELLFEVGQHKMTIGELQALQPGYVFDLNRPVDHPVRILANGKVIGSCELVNIDNRIGARITDIKRK
ncbi:Yop proteins translocation protein Q [invertebrate metagenome]|uniref:Yop proteins translocation protein Q n=1 Tax=invertebrate metagenome TaxID=1711999 RepID=A0A2H9TA59_9ZZZZ